MLRTHLRIEGVGDDGGFKTSCGYIGAGKLVTRNGDLVDCELCLKSDGMKHHHQINNTLTDSQGCI